MPRPLACVALLLLASLTASLAQSNVTRIRFFPAPGRAGDMVGGRFTGSVESATNGFVEFARITAVPTEGGWTEITIPDHATVYRWIKYEAPPFSAGAVAEVEFYSGETRLTGTGFGTTSGNATPFGNALDGDTATFFLSNDRNDQYVGIELPGSVQVAQPSFSPNGGSFPGSVQVTLSCATAGATIIYTTDGTTPSPTNGTPVSSGIRITLTPKSTLVAYARRAGLADSTERYATYLPGTTSGQTLRTFHTGNSLTDTINNVMAPIGQSGGHSWAYFRYTIPGAPTDWLWANPGSGTYSYPHMFDNNGPFDHMSFQPFAGHGRAIDNEAYYGSRFIQRARYVYPADSAVPTTNGRKVFTPSLGADNQPIARSPNVQPWVYVQWPTRSISDGWSLGTGGMAPFNFWPAATLPEGVAHHVFYTERIRDRVNEISASGTTSFGTEDLHILPGTKPARIVPGGVTVARLAHLIDTGRLPGVDPGRGISFHYFDGVHLTSAGRYATALTFYGALLGEDPSGKVMSASSGLTPEQAAIYQQVAWDVVQNYPLAGVYQEGPTKVGNPTCSPGVGPIGDSIPVTFSSSTPGAWFRYTIDGTDPSPTRGLLAIGHVTVRPGMALRVIGFRHGHAPSDVVAFTFPATPGSRLLHAESFSGIPGLLAGTNDNNPGWSSRWRVSNDNTTSTYRITGGSSLTYGTLKTSGGLLDGGGPANIALARPLNLVPSSGPFRSYVRAADLQPRGRELWLSVLLRKDGNDDTAVAAYVTPQGDTTSNLLSNSIGAVGYFGTSSNNGGRRYWSLRSGSSVTRTNVEVVPGQTVLLVLRLADGSPNRVELFVNPTNLGGAAPATPSASVTTTASLRVNSIAFDFRTNGGAADEVRLGESFGAVTPIPVGRVALSRGGNDLAPGGQDVIAETVEGVAAPVTYTMTNSGDGSLDVSAVTFSGQLNVAAALDSAPTTINPAQSAPLALRVTPAARGPWSVTVTIASNDPSRPTFSFTLGGEALSRYAAWTGGIPWNDRDPAPGADPDRDGVANLAEFFHALDPLVPDADRATELEPGTDAVRFRFRRLKERGNVTYRFLGSETLAAASWSLLPPLTETIVSATDTMEVVEVSVPTAGRPRYFVRLEVAAP